MGLELLAEAGNYAVVQRMLQSNPYWAAYHPHAAYLLSGVDSMYYRNSTAAAAASLPGMARPVHPRVFMPAMPQGLSQLPPPPQH